MAFSADCEDKVENADDEDDDDWGTISSCSNNWSSENCTSRSVSATAGTVTGHDLVCSEEEEEEGEEEGDLLPLLEEVGDGLRTFVPVEHKLRWPLLL